MNRFLKVLLSVLVILAIVSLTFMATVLWMQGRYAQLLSTDGVKYKMQAIGHMLDTYFIEEYDEAAVEQAAADGAAAAMIAASGDRWSFYISASDMQAYEEQMTNTYVGIGVMIQAVDAGMEIMSVTPGSPAEEAGVRVGDICTKVEGQETADLGVDGTQAIVRGEPGSFVNMCFMRDGREFEAEIQRRTIISDVAELEMLDHIGLIRIYNFDQHCAEQTLACVDRALESGARALLFDVRFNGGGLKTEMVEILDALLPEGELFRSVDYRGTEEIDRSDAACLELPMAVLVNEESYSAAEFFAAALQEYDAAQIVGVQTVGKGNFQYTLDVGDGSAVSLSVGKYYTPQGKSLTDVGVTPDVEAELSYEDYVSLYYGSLPSDEDEQIAAAVNVLKERLADKIA